MNGIETPHEARPVVPKGFWAQLRAPIRALAPMEDVTDSVFRRIVASCGRPDVFFTEFTHVAHIVGRKKKSTAPRLVFTDEERPLVVQIWGRDPEQFFRATLKVREMGFDGIDINMGCPVKKIKKTGACSALIREPEHAVEIVHAVQEAAGETPVSVKTRIGFDRVVTEDWIGALLRRKIAVLTVHGRIASQLSEGEADWTEIARAARIRDEVSPETLVIGNGDVMTAREIPMRCRLYGIDGVMVGRAIFRDPFFFDTRGRSGRFASAQSEEKLALLERHIALHREVWNGRRNYEVLKRFYKVYLTGFDDAARLRDRLNRTFNYAEAEAVLAEYRSGLEHIL